MLSSAAQNYISDRKAKKMFMGARTENQINHVYVSCEEWEEIKRMKGDYTAVKELIENGNYKILVGPTKEDIAKIRDQIKQGAKNPMPNETGWIRYPNDGSPFMFLAKVDAGEHPDMRQRP